MFQNVIWGVCVGGFEFQKILHLFKHNSVNTLN